MHYLFLLPSTEHGQKEVVIEERHGAKLFDTYPTYEICVQIIF